jgi:hypothetical protein
MVKFDAVSFANTLSVQRLIHQRLSPPDCSDQAEWQLSGVRVCALRACNRTGVEAPAATWRYLLTADDWELTARAVWETPSNLRKPLAVHAVVESYNSDDGDPSRARLAANRWFRSLEGF